MIYKIFRQYFPEHRQVNDQMDKLRVTSIAFSKEKKKFSSAGIRNIFQEESGR